MAFISVLWKPHLHQGSGIHVDTAENATTCLNMSAIHAETPKLSRRAMLSVLSLGLAGVCTKSPFGEAHAESMRELSVRNKVTQLLQSRAKATALQARLGTRDDSGSNLELTQDEEYLVRQYASVWLSPAIDALRDIAKSEVDVGPGIDVAGRALAVHIVELNDECDRRSRSGCARELDEYISTITDVLGKEGMTHFVKGKRWNGSTWSDS